MLTFLLLYTVCTSFTCLHCIISRSHSQLYGVYMYNLPVVKIYNTHRCEPNDPILHVYEMM